MDTRRNTLTEHLEIPGILETFRNDRLFVTVYSGVGLLLFIATSLGYPVTTGADFSSYLEYYYKASPEFMLFRTAGSSWPIGMISEHGYNFFSFCVILLYLIFLGAVYYASQILGPTLGRVVSVVILLHFSLTARFHAVDADTILTLGIALWMALVVRLFRNRSLTASMTLGLASFVLVTIKPSTLLFGMFALYPLLCHGLSWSNARRALMFLAAFVSGAIGLSSYNYYHYNAFVVAGQSNIMFPAASLFRNTHIYARENGPASRELFDLVQTRLIDTQLYKDHHIDIKTFFSRWDPRTWGDFGSLDDLRPGIIRQASIEAIIAHPTKFLTWSILFPGYQILVATYPLDNPMRITSTEEKSATTENKAKALTTNYTSTPESNEYYRWRHRTQEEIERSSKITQKINSIYNKLHKSYDYNESIHLYPAYIIFSFLARIVPPMLFFVATSLLLFRKWHSESARLLLLTSFIALTVVSASSILEVLPRYRIPFDFILILSGIAGIAHIGLFRQPTDRAILPGSEDR
ncbi:MAG: hypothetical protein HQM01_12970 [Magnetococcales bacterium]|nr:hypothetical protein [Magnetococcales bacterium]